MYRRTLEKAEALGYLAATAGIMYTMLVAGVGYITVKSALGLVTTVGPRGPPS